MNLEDMMLSDSSQTQKDMYGDSTYKNVQNRQTHRDKKQIGGGQGLGDGSGSDC